MNNNGGYRRTHSFAFACLIYLATEIFCRRNYNYRNDALGKTVGQMIGAARSARQNIVEASSRGTFSNRQEAQQYDVARGSLHELAGDYESFILGKQQPPWSENEERAKEVANLKVDEFRETNDVSHKFGIYILEMEKRFSSFLENEDPIIAAQSILITIRRAAAMLMKQIHYLTENEKNNQTSPRCPECGSPMRLLTARHGASIGKKFWSCSNYPSCTGKLSLS